MIVENDIRVRSYQLWEAAGRPQGQDVEFWLRAESELMDEKCRAPRLIIKTFSVPVPRILAAPSLRRTTATRIPPRPDLSATISATR
jgi:hypothetical protein